MLVKYQNEIFNIKLENSIDKSELLVNDIKYEIISKAFSNNCIVFSDTNIKKIAYYAEDKNNIYVNIDGCSYILEKVKEEQQQYGEDSSNTGSRDVIKPPMPGTVVKVLVQKNQKVNEGDALIIVEAMKMETTLYSAINGVVTEINASQGEQVDSDKVLIIVEKEESEQ